jgi:hypothetical protein
MTFTKEQISKMKEEEFQNTVLIPLFRKMGFHDVTAFGGGSLELGKDIVMWKLDALGQRVNYGVVVKAKKITGNAETNEGAMNVLNQVRQTLKNPYVNPVSGELEHIGMCFVACSKEINKEAMNSIKGDLENNFDKLVRWIHPKTNLYDLIEQYLSEQTVFEKLSEVQKKLDEPMKDAPYRIIANSDGKLSLVGKHDKAHEEMPFVINSTLKFDTKTDEGKKAFEKVKEHFEKGTPLEISGKHIEGLEFPDFLPDFLIPSRNSITDNAKLILEPIRYNVPSWRIERKLDDGEIFILDRIDLQITQSGTKEFTLKNDKQDVPWQFVFVINLERKVVNLNFNLAFFGFNVYQHLQGLKFLKAMSREGKTSIYLYDTNQKFIDSVEGKHITNISNQDLSFRIRLMEALVLIQEKTKTGITFSEQAIPAEEIKHIFETAEIVQNGKITYSINDFRTTFPLEKAKEVINHYKDEKVNWLFMRQEEIRYILGYEIDFGISIFNLNCFILHSTFNEISSQIQNKKKQIEFCFTPIEKNLVIDFLKFECEDRHTRYQIVDS